MKKAFSAIGISVAIIIVSLAAVYLLLGKYYSDGFSCSTWVNGVYCTGKTVDEVNRELVSLNVYPGICLLGPDDTTLFIGASEVDLKLDYTRALEQILREQNPYAWGINIFKNLYVQYEPTVSLNEDKFREKVLSWDIFQGQEDLKVEIKDTEDGYILVNGLTNIPNKNNIIAASKTAMQNLEISIDLTAYDNTFTDIPLSTEDKKTVALYEKLDSILNCGISFAFFNETIPVSRKDVGNFILTEDWIEEVKEERLQKNNSYLGRFIAGSVEKEEILDDPYIIQNGFVLDENGDFILSESKMHEFVSGLSDRYNTKNLMEEYRAGTNLQILISNNQKGNGQIFNIYDAFLTLKDSYIDGSFQTEKLVTVDLLDNVKVYNAETDIGNTYIEVNMGDQMLYYYVDGNLNMDMPIVTGNVNRNRGTPTGIFNVYNKRYHTYLRGVDYVSYVNYWLGVNKGVGIHDANWRSEFGSEIYKRDGSHGCINCPEEKVSKLWEVVDVGTPVVLYY